MTFGLPNSLSRAQNCVSSCTFRFLFLGHMLFEKLTFLRRVVGSPPFWLFINTHFSGRSRSCRWCMFLDVKDAWESSPKSIYFQSGYFSVSPDWRHCSVSPGILISLGIPGDTEQHQGSPGSWTIPRVWRYRRGSSLKIDTFWAALPGIFYVQKNTSSTRTGSTRDMGIYQKGGETAIQKNLWRFRTFCRQTQRFVQHCKPSYQYLMVG
jgi:hypothetical protein